MIVMLVRTVVLFFVLIIAIRIMGKRQIGELQPGELVITILISECAAAPLQDTSRPVINGIIAIFTLVILEVLLSFIGMKLPKIRRLISGRPQMIIRNGKINRKAMQNLRISLDDLVDSLRKKDIFNIDAVSYAVVETDGSVSALIKEDEVKSIQFAVIEDGKINETATNLCGMSREQIFDILSKRKVMLKEVFLMTADDEGEIYLIKDSDIS